MSLAQTEYISNRGNYFESSGSCDTTLTATQSTEINTELLESETIIPAKLGFNMCVEDTSDDTPYVSDYIIKAVARSKTCRLELHSNGSWEEDDGDDC